jgi:DNA-binding transcriptional ArsR family regulator
MALKEELLDFLETHRDKGYTVKEIMRKIDGAESNIRKHLRGLNEEGLIEAHEGDDVYYGFTGVKCEFTAICGETKETCMDMAHKCQKREGLLEGWDDDEEEDEE